MASGALSAWIFLTHLSSLFLPVVKRQQREKESERERQRAREVLSTIVLNAIEPFKTSDMQARNKYCNAHEQAPAMLRVDILRLVWHCSTIIPSLI